MKVLRFPPVPPAKSARDCSSFVSCFYIRPKSFAALCCAGFLALTASKGQAQILSEWSFNNAASTTTSQNGGPSVGSFSTAAAAYGEAYVNGNQNGNSNSGMLLSNTAGVFSGSNVNISFAPYYVNGSYDANGGYSHDSIYGVGYDATTGTTAVNPAGGTGGAGSLFLGSSYAATLNINLQSTGYTNLSLNFSAAVIAADSGNAPTTNSFDQIGLYYSVDGGGTFTNFANIVASGAFASQSLSLPTGAENANSLVVQLQLSYENANGNHGDNVIELDDLSLTAAPEPSTWVMMLGSLGLLGAATRLRRGCKA